MEAQAGIENLKSAMAHTKNLIEIVGEIMKDGEVNIKDIRQLPGLISESRDLVLVLKNVGEEAKDLDSAELKELLVLVLDLSLKIGEKLGLKVD